MLSFGVVPLISGLVVFVSGIVVLVSGIVVFSRVELPIVPFTGIGIGIVVFVSGCVSFPSAFTCIAAGDRASRSIKVYGIILRFILFSLATLGAWLY